VGSRRVDEAVRHYLSETGSGANLRTPVVRAADRATWVRLTADVIADIKARPGDRACPATRAVLEGHLDFVTRYVSETGDTVDRPMAGEFVHALRAEAAVRGDAVEVAQPLVTVAATLAQLELVLTAASDPAAPGKDPVDR
jgi:hypothetical protein